MGASTASRNRAVRQEALREWLSKKCTAQHLVDNIIKIEELDTESETFRNDLDKYRVANEQRLKVLNKYLPDLKATEHSVEQESPLSDLLKLVSGKTLDPK